LPSFSGTPTKVLSIPYWLIEGDGGAGQNTLAVALDAIILYGIPRLISEPSG
jgi:hypothetical protein